MLNGGFWQGLKDYYEKEYNGIMASKKAEEYAVEMENNSASFLNYDRAFDPDEISTWIEDTETLSDMDEVLEDFPNFNSYSKYIDEIASFFMWDYIDDFRNKVANGNKEFTDEAIRLNWLEMLEEIPTVKDIFLF